MRRRVGILLAGVALLVLALVGGRALVGSESSRVVKPAHRTVGRDLGEALAKAGRGITLPGRSSHADAIVIAGTVIDAQSTKPVGKVEVVFRSELGEETTQAGADGSYRIEVQPGIYRAFVRDEFVLSVGMARHVRLPTLPSSDTVGVPDEALMPVVVATGDADGVDLSVLRGGAVSGRVVDRAGRPVAGAILRARTFNGIRPTLGTDLAETDNAGTYSLQLPAGNYELEANHPKFAGVSAGTTVMVAGGDRVSADVTLVAGCVIAGRVIAAGGGPSGDGAIEKRWDVQQQFSPSGKINPDGTFRWVTTETADITLRAWPWKSPPSPPQTFACDDGARHENVVFRVPDRQPDIAGVLVDKSGARVPFAFIDLAPLDVGGISQQERTDAEGKWAVFDMPAGRYQITAHASARGVVALTVTAPARDVVLELGGTGRLEGSTTLLANGSFELGLAGCTDGTTQVDVPEDKRLVTVTSGRFSVEDVPACELSIQASWHGHVVPAKVTVPAGGTGRVELAIGPPRTKTVTGTVRDGAGRPMPHVLVTATYDDQTARATTDDSGGYELSTFSGAELEATVGDKTGFGLVGMANVNAEIVDLVLEPDNRDHFHGDD
ncbi:MAG TPA: carboxypeptidase-like regulatory domain-containing protein [Kofleriaceae bacterium]